MGRGSIHDHDTGPAVTRVSHPAIVRAAIFYVCCGSVVGRINVHGRVATPAVTRVGNHGTVPAAICSVCGSSADGCIFKVVHGYADVSSVCQALPPHLFDVLMRLLPEVVPSSLCASRPKLQRAGSERINR